MNELRRARRGQSSLTAAAIEAARQAILQRLELRLPGAGAITVVPTVVQLHNMVVFTCKRANRLAAVNLWVAMEGDPDVLAERAIDELEATQIHALEAPPTGKSS